MWLFKKKNPFFDYSTAVFPSSGHNPHPSHLSPHRPEPKEAPVNEDLRALQINYPIGKKILVRSNEPGPLLIGEVIDYIPLTQAKQYSIVFKDQYDRELICMTDRPHDYTPEKYAMLQRFEWWEQWNLLCGPAHAHFDRAAVLHKEAMARHRIASTIAQELYDGEETNTDQTDSTRSTR